MNKLLLVLVPSALVLVAVVAFIAFDDRGPPPAAGPGPQATQFPTCPVMISERLAAALEQGHDADLWRIYRFDGSGQAPEIAAKPNGTIAPGGGLGASCELEIVSAPRTSGGGMDWRIGHVARISPALRGKPVTMRMHLKGSAPLTFDAGEIYIHDGSGSTPSALRRVGTDWQTVTLTRRLAPEATQVEFWLRVAFDRGTVSPSGQSLFFAVELDSPEL